MNATIKKALAGVVVTAGSIAMIAGSAHGLVLGAMVRRAL